MSDRMVLLREWDPADAPDLAAAINNINVLRNLRDGVPYPYSVPDAEDFIRSTLNADPNSVYARAIRVDGKVVGSVGAFRQENVHHFSAEMGYYLAEEYWGGGIMTIAVREAVGEIFKTTDIARIFATPYSYNAASCRVLEKAGFVFEGTLRKHAFKDGRFLDMNLYAVLKEGLI
ncbi:MAG: GNAT family N-acetyltransferase [Clostridiales bacterium]|jgi:RimJ/RimL family protein N-acetyltransferase|nr:GNAT family N-acetyltransferase [Clostridiales bacterium]